MDILNRQTVDFTGDKLLPLSTHQRHIGSPSDRASNDLRYLKVDG